MARRMEQCLSCSLYVWLKPLPEETFAFCCGRGETVKDVDLKQGVSPAIKQHLAGREYCSLFSAGPSISETSAEEPFKLHLIRERGEKYLREVLLGAGQ